MPAIRFDTTLKAASFEELEAVSTELDVAKSAIVEEALAVLFKAVRERKGGRRLVFVDPDGSQPAIEFSSPILEQLEWAHARTALKLSPVEKARAVEVLRRPAKAGRALSRAMGRLKSR